jgi:outer membrane protein assembly factor BamB
MPSVSLLFVTTLVLAASTVAAQDWPSFRGPNGSGVASARPPLTWNLSSARDVAWRVAIPGLGHSSPIVSGDRIYLTTAVSDLAASRSLTLGDSDRAGIAAAPDLVPHEWRVIALDRGTGRPVWSRTLHRGVPRVKRHVKSSHASATPSTDGRVVVAMLGSEGLFAFDREGQERGAGISARFRSALPTIPPTSGGPRAHRSFTATR